MKKKVLACLIIFATFLVMTQSVEQVGFCKTAYASAASVNLIKSETKITSVLWKQEYNINKNKSIKLDLNGDKKLDEVRIGMNTQMGSLAKVYMNGVAINLLDISKLYKNEMLFDEGGDLKEGYHMQVAFFDFDNDKKPEIIVSAGDNLIDLGVSIFKYTGNKTKPYSEIGYIEGQSFVFITKQKTIMAPYGSQGLFTEYKYYKGKFVEAT